MIQDAIRMIAAALCGEGKKLEVPAAHDPALAPVLDLILLLTGYAEISLAGKARIQPIARAPVKAVLRFQSLKKEMFYLFAGLVTKLDAVMFVEEIEDGITDAELKTLSDAMNGVFVSAWTPSGLAVSAYALDDAPVPGADVSPVYVAGTILGASLCVLQTTFRFGPERSAPEIVCAIESLNACGGEATENEDGSVTVTTYRHTRFHTKTGKRMRRRTTPCS